MSSTVTSIGTTVSNASATATSLAVTGLASGMNWSTIVTELGNAERAPETQWVQEQNTNATKNAAYATVASDLTALQLDAQTLSDPSFYQSAVASSSDSSVATASVNTGTPAGNYAFNISQLATAAQLAGASYVSQVLDPGGNPAAVTIGSAGFGTPVTAGVFTVNGAPVTIATTDSLQDVFNAIAAATNNKVTASYNATTDEISLASSDGSAITLGSSSDTSNFLSVARLYNDNGTGTNNTGSISSTSSLGRVNTSAVLASAELKTPIAAGPGKFTINGVSFAYNPTTDSIQDILNNINESTAGVSAAYDSINNRFTLANVNTGDVGISVQDVTGNFLAATGLSGGTLNHGNNLLYTLNGSSQIISQSNVIDDTSSGVTGLTVTVLDKGTTTVSVNSDTATISKAIQKFVTDYNTIQSYMTSQQAVSTAADGTVTAGTLTGDSTTSEIITNLRSLANAVTNISGSSGSVKSLADLGFQSSGNNNTISLSDASALTSMLTSHLNDVRGMFADTTSGLAVQMNAYVNTTNGTSGILTTRQANLTQQNADITTQISNLETKVSNDSQQWSSEFQAMETAESQTNQELTYLSQGVSNGSL
jgi:flagellar hook-associated protein 2